MLLAVLSECEFVRKFPLKYSRGQHEIQVLRNIMQWGMGGGLFPRKKSVTKVYG